MGDLMEGTYCSRIFSDCDKKRCVLQSPNYPGLYPRNLTCYYAIRQHDIPYGYQALISITQPYSRLVSIKTEHRSEPEASADQKSVERKVYYTYDNTLYDYKGVPNIMRLFIMQCIWYTHILTKL